MPKLRIQLFGSFQLFIDGKVVTTINKRGQMVLAYLLLNRDQIHCRETIAALLWPDTNDAQARTNLRKELMRLRHALEVIGLQSFLTDKHGMLAWRADSPFDLDVVEFEESLRCAKIAAERCDENGSLVYLENALRVYRSDLLINLYHEWILSERQQLADQYMLALERIIILLTNRQDFGQAISYARKLVQYEPLDESAYRQLMELYAQKEDFVNVKRTYHSCLSMLQSELAVRPSPITERSFSSIMSTNSIRCVTAQT